MREIDHVAKKKSASTSNNDTLQKQREMLRGIFESKKKENH
jgi:hypothetical protein